MDRDTNRRRRERRWVKALEAAQETANTLTREADRVDQARQEWGLSQSPKAKRARELAVDIEAQHQALVHPDGSPCLDGCDLPAHPDGWQALDRLMEEAGPLVNEAGSYSADTYRLRPLED
jgi:hypothetical protein